MVEESVIHYKDVEETTKSQMGMTLEDFLWALRFINETQKEKGSGLRYGIVPEADGYHMYHWDDKEEK